MSDNKVIDISSKLSNERLLRELKRTLNSKAIIVVSVREDGESFDSFVDDNISDIDFCYAIDCLKERRKILKDERSL